MMFSRSDFKINNFEDFLKSAPIFVFVGLVAPFLIAAYSLGFIMEMVGWTDAPDRTLGNF